jgi:SM-20-related protein
MIDSGTEDWLESLAAEVQSKGFSVRDTCSAISGVDPAAFRIEAENRRDKMKTSTISSGLANENDESKRSDRVTFLKVNEVQDSPNFAQHIRWMEQVRENLEIKLKLGMEKSTFMLAEYPGEGARYVKHRDSAPSDYAGRKLTCIYYLNPNWIPEHGGELHLWPNHMVVDDEAEVEPVRIIPPIIDRLVVFRSFMEHEVKPAFSCRMALTAWFVNKRHMALELMCEQLSLQQDRQEAKREAASRQT